MIYVISYIGLSMIILINIAVTILIDNWIEVQEEMLNRASRRIFWETKNNEIYMSKVGKYQRLLDEITRINAEEDKSAELTKEKLREKMTLLDSLAHELKIHMDPNIPATAYYLMMQILDLGSNSNGLVMLWWRPAGDSGKLRKRSVAKKRDARFKARHSIASSAHRSHTLREDIDMTPQEDAEYQQAKSTWRPGLRLDKWVYQHNIPFVIVNIGPHDFPLDDIEPFNIGTDAGDLPACQMWEHGKLKKVWTGADATGLTEQELELAFLGGFENNKQLRNFTRRFEFEDALLKGLDAAILDKDWEDDVERTPESLTEKQFTKLIKSIEANTNTDERSLASPIEITRTFKQLLDFLDKHPSYRKIGFGDKGSCGGGGTKFEAHEDEVPIKLLRDVVLECHGDETNVDASFLDLKHILEKAHKSVYGTAEGGDEGPLENWTPAQVKEWVRNTGPAKSWDEYGDILLKADIDGPCLINLTAAFMIEHYGMNPAHAITLERKIKDLIVSDYQKANGRDASKPRPNKKKLRGASSPKGTVGRIKQLKAKSKTKDNDGPTGL